MKLEELLELAVGEEVIITKIISKDISYKYKVGDRLIYIGITPNPYIFYFRKNNDKELLHFNKQISEYIEPVSKLRDDKLDILGI